MTRIGLGLVSIMGASLAGAVTFQHYIVNPAKEQVAKICAGFKKESLEKHRICYDRAKVRAAIRRQVSTDGNAVGITFVCGRVSCGKTTAIIASLKDRKNVCSMNWREKTFPNASALDAELRREFGITSIFSFMDNVEWRGVVEVMQWLGLFPKLTRGADHNLESTLDSITDALSFLKHQTTDGKLRAVMHIDETGDMEGLTNLIGNQKYNSSVMTTLVKWMVHISKDEDLADVVIASTDGFYLDFLSSVDPQYITTIVLDDFSVQDIDDIIKTNFPDLPHWARSIVDRVGGHGYHVAKLIELASETKDRHCVEEFFEQLKNQERHALQQVASYISELCSVKAQDYFFVNSAMNKCTTTSLADMHKVLMTLLAERSEINRHDPAIPISTLIRVSGVSEDFIRKLVSKRLLFYNPAQGTIKARTPLFLQVYDEEVNSSARIESLKGRIRNEEFQLKFNRDKDGHIINEFVEAKTTSKLAELRHELTREEARQKRK